MQSEKIVKEMQKIAGENLPIRVIIDADGNIQTVEYDKVWKEGSTTPVEKKTKKGVVIDYKEDYKEVKLSKSDIKKLDEYIAGLAIKV